MACTTLASLVNRLIMCTINTEPGGSLCASVSNATGLPTDGSYPSGLLPSHHCLLKSLRGVIPRTQSHSSLTIWSPRTRLKIAVVVAAGSVVQTATNGTLTRRAFFTCWTIH